MGIRLMKHHLPFESRSQCAAGKFGETPFVQDTSQTCIMKYEEVLAPRKFIQRRILLFFFLRLVEVTKIIKKSSEEDWRIDI